MMRKYYTPKEVAEELRVTQRTIYEWLTTGRLRGMRAGSRWRIRPEDVEAFLRGTKGDAVVRSEPAGEVDAAEHAARVDALVGNYAHVPFSTEDLFRERRQDAEEESRRDKNMSIIADPDLKALIADKAALRRILDEQDALSGFIPDPEATPQRARELMLADGIRPEDNEFSREIVQSREE